MPNKINIDKVSGFSPVRATGKGDVRKSAGEAPQSVDVNKVKNEDKVELSNRATTVGKYIEQVKNLADSRAEKVNQLREQVSSGSYNPSSNDIADAILKDENI